MLNYRKKSSGFSEENPRTYEERLSSLVDNLLPGKLIVEIFLSRTKAVSKRDKLLLSGLNHCNFQCKHYFEMMFSKQNDQRNEIITFNFKLYIISAYIKMRGHHLFYIFSQKVA